MIKAVFFDWDFTLVDPRPALERMLEEVYKREKIKKKYTLNQLLPYNTGQVIKKLELDRHTRVYLLYEYLKLSKKYRRYYKFKGRDILKFLEKNKIPYVIITDNFTKAIKKRFPIHPRLIVDYLHTRGNKYRGIRKALRKMRLKPHEVCYVGDRVSDISHAKRAGVFTVAITTTVKKEELEKHSPDMIISNLNQLKKLFKL